LRVVKVRSEVILSSVKRIKKIAPEDNEFEDWCEKACEAINAKRERRAKTQRNAT
jgi:hypothetical protein